MFSSLLFASGVRRGVCATTTPTLATRAFAASGSANVGVLAEHVDGALTASTLSTITAGAQLGSVTLVVAGKDVGAVAEQAKSVAGVAKVLTIDGDTLARPLAEPHARALVAAQKACSFTHVLAPATPLGKSIAPRAAALLDVGQVSEVVEIVDDDTFVHPIYAGNAMETVKSLDAVKFLTVRATAFAKAATDGGAATTDAAADAVPAADDASRWQSVELVKSERPALESAARVVAGGRAFGSEEKFALLYSLADKLGAAAGASRAAVDAGYCPNDMQVGQTGKIVAPELYFAIGISGAIQHLAGMKDSKIIVAINKNADAPIFQVADYGLVGDLFTVLPELEGKL